MNSVVLMGRLVRDPDVRYSQGQEQMAIARYTLAVDRRGRKQEGQQNADFISCISFGKAGEFVEKYLRKGTKITLRGHIQTGSYENKDGQRVYTTDVVTDEIEFSESKNAQSEGGNFTPAKADNSGRRYQNPAPQYTQNQVDDRGGFMSIPDGIDEELPFN